METSHWLLLGVGGPVVIIGSALLELEIVLLVAGVGASWMELLCVGPCEVEVSWLLMLTEPSLAVWHRVIY